MANNTLRFTKLPITSCHTFDLPEETGYDCSFEDENHCIKCSIRSRFTTGERLDDYSGLGHIICILLCMLTFIIGTCGALGNLLIIMVLKRQRNKKAFDIFLIGLAAFDFLCSVVSVVASITAVIIFQNWSKGVVTLCLFWIPTLTSLFMRSGSSFMTVLITVERYLVIAFPVQTINLFSVKRAKWMVLAVLIFSFLLAFPRYSSMVISRNRIGNQINSTKHLQYIIEGTRLTKFWYVDTKGFFDQIDFWTPLPLLLIFNGLIYYHIIKFNSRRKELNMKHKKDIRAAKMFLPVVIILFLCNIVPIIHYYFVFNRIVYKELLLGIFLSYVVNSAVNLPIYYLRGSNFRKDTRAVLVSYFPFMESYLVGTGGNSKDKTNVGTRTTEGSASNDLSDNGNAINLA